MHRTLRFQSLLSLALLVSCALGNKNVTINDDDSSIIYSRTNGGTTAVSFACQFDSNGNIVANQAGCVNTSPQACTDHVHLMTDQGTSASLKFNGSAIYISALLGDSSALYTVTLDGKSQQVDGYRNSGPLLCTTLFSQSGLDTRTEHEISVTIQGPSPESSNGNNVILPLDNFIITLPDSANVTQSVSASSGASGTPTASGSSVASPSKTSNAVVRSSSVIGVLLAGAAVLRSLL